MASKNQIQVTFGGADTVSVAAGADETSDTFTLNSDSSGSAIELKVKVKADNEGTPESGDEIEVYLGEGGDPDNDAATDLDTIESARLVMVLNTNDEDPAVRTTALPDDVFFDSAVLYLRSQAPNNSITCSAIALEAYV